MNGSSKRDQAVERLLRESPAIVAAEPVGADACLDGETLAAWMDGALSAVARESAEAHVAGCLRCQRLLSAFVRTEGASDASGQEVEGVATGVHRWFGWLVPLTAAAAALVLWVMVPRTADVPAPETMSARVEPVPAPAPTASPMVGGLASPPAVEEFKETQDRFRAELKADAPAVLRDSRQAAAAKAESYSAVVAPAPQAQERFDRVAEPQQRERLEQGSAGANAAADSVAAAAPRPAAPPPPPPAAAAASPAPARAVEARSAAAQAPAVISANVAGVPTITTPDPRVRWRLMGSRVERTDDNGSTWREIYQQPAVMLTIGVAPSVNVCWIVGRGGAVVRTTDGRTFSKLPFPNTFHLVSVSATDAQNAIVRTVNGMTFATNDGGASWMER